MRDASVVEPEPDGCLACDLSSGRRPLPGGRIHETDHWLVEHCDGPLGLGTLIVKPARHVTALAELSDAEAAELGPLLTRAAGVAARLVEATQVYSCLWSHAGRVPGHLHFVVQPVTADQVARLGAVGPRLQVAMLAPNERPDPADVERVAATARRLFTAPRSW